jgi:hypothetical protein
MEGYLKKQLYVWVYDKIKSNPKEFGGDFSSQQIAFEYLNELYSNFRVMDLNPQIMSVLATITRIKNKLLERNPQFDYRIKHKSKKVKNSEENLITMKG